MKTLYKTLAVLVLLGLLITPQADALMSATMVRKVVFEPLLLLMVGAAVARPFSLGRMRLLAPAAVTAATLLIVIWMIPRSVDLTQIYTSARVLYILSLLAAGLLLSCGLPSLPSVARAVYAIYASSMIVAVGLLYSFQSTLWCSAYTLDDQHRFGETFVALGIVGHVITLIFLPRWLVHRPSDIASERLGA